MKDKTVRELSEEWGISRQAIQKRIKKLPSENQPRKVEGRYVLSQDTVSMLEAIYHQPEQGLPNKEVVNRDNQLTDNRQPVVENILEEIPRERDFRNGEEKESLISEDLGTSQTDNRLTDDKRLSVGNQENRFINELIKDKANLHDIIDQLEERLKENQNLLNQQQQLTLQSNKQIEKLQNQLMIAMKDESVPGEQDNEEQLEVDNQERVNQLKKELQEKNQEIELLTVKVKEEVKLSFWKRLFGTKE